MNIPQILKLMQQSARLKPDLLSKLPHLDENSDLFSLKKQKVTVFGKSF